MFFIFIWEGAYASDIAVLFCVKVLGSNLSSDSAGSLEANRGCFPAPQPIHGD
jgi:hypothetical protein